MLLPGFLRNYKQPPLFHELFLGVSSSRQGVDRSGFHLALAQKQYRNCKNPALREADSLANADPAVNARRLVVETHPWWAAKGSVLK